VSAVETLTKEVLELAPLKLLCSTTETGKDAMTSPSTRREEEGKHCYRKKKSQQ
jgi:hypothetical protein